MKKSTPFDTVQYLTDPETFRHYLEQTFEAGDPTLKRGRCIRFPRLGVKIRVPDIKRATTGTFS